MERLGGRTGLMLCFLQCPGGYLNGLLLDEREWNPFKKS